MLWVDELHLYPTVSTALAMWTLCMASQVVLRVAWLLLRAQRNQKVRVWTSDKGDAAKIRKRWPWWTTSGCEGDGEDCKSSALRMFPLWCVMALRAGFHEHHRGWLWKTLMCRSLWLTLLVVVAIVGLNTSLLYLRTGSFVQQPYEWYSLEATGKRVYGDRVMLPTNILATCRAVSAEVPVKPVDTTALLRLDDVIARHRKDPAGGATIVYVVPYGPRGVVHVTHAQASVQVHQDSITKATSSHRGAVMKKEAPVQYTRVVPVDALTMFPYVWHSILGTGFSDQLQSQTNGSSLSLSPSPFTRSIPSAQLEFRLLQSQQQLDTLPPNSNLLAVVQAMDHVLHLADHTTDPKTKIAFVALSKEDCNNPHATKITSHPQIQFGLFPYGDCSIINNSNEHEEEARFSVLPLGPSFEHGFPLNTHETYLPPVSHRKHLLNLMVSWTVEKPTRIQAMIAALAVCDGRDCVVEHNDLAFKVLQKLDTAIGSNLRWLLSSAPNAYMETMKQSIFTLCPLGKNPEQYRIWEALAAGSIPIIEDLPSLSPGQEEGDEELRYQPGAFYHPSYPTTWKCRPDFEIHGFLKQKKAPVVFIKDWKTDLPKVIQFYTKTNPQKLVELQEQVKKWYLEAGEHLQAQLVGKSLKFFASPPSQAQGNRTDL